MWLWDLMRAFRLGKAKFNLKPFKAICPFLFVCLGLSVFLFLLFWVFFLLSKNTSERQVEEKVIWCESSATVISAES